MQNVLIFDPHKRTTHYTMNDETNPHFTFSATRNAILCDAVQGKVNLLHLAALELANRGYDHNGEFVGFVKSQEIFDEFIAQIA